MPDSLNSDRRAPLPITVPGRFYRFYGALDPSVAATLQPQVRVSERRFRPFLDLPRGTEAVLRCLPRRSPLTTSGGHRGPPPLKLSRVAPRASLARAGTRSVRWGFAGLKLVARLIRDWVRRRRSGRQLGRRLRQTFEEMGDTAVRIGLALSPRIDLLSSDICAELARLSDQAPPMELDYAVARVEAASGRPLAAVFERFDPEPLNSSSIACAYQATLRGGQQVAVKVRRPHAVRRFATDLRLINWLTQLPEFLAAVRPGFFSKLRAAINDMLLEELDFLHEARQQRLFRRAARKAKLRWLSAPKVFVELSSADVMVSEFAHGISCKDLLAAVEANDHRALAHIESLGISLRKVAQRLLHTQLWSSIEALFYHADPSASNILVRGGSRLVFLDFGSCGYTPGPMRRHISELLERTLDNDASGMAEVALHLLSPLPPVDVYELKKRIEGECFNFLFALRDRKSGWWHGTMMSLWSVVVEPCRAFRMPVNPDVMRLFHASIQYDNVAFRLDPRMRLVRQYRRYLRRSTARRARTASRRLQRLSPKQLKNQLSERALDAAEGVRFSAWSIESLMENAPAQVTAMINKGAYISALLLRILTGAIFVIGIPAAVLWAMRKFRGVETDLLKMLREDILAHPGVVTALLVLAILGARWALFRLDERDSGGQLDS